MLHNVTNGNGLYINILPSSVVCCNCTQNPTSPVLNAIAMSALNFWNFFPTVARKLHSTPIGPQFRFFGLDFDDVNDDPEVA